MAKVREFIVAAVTQNIRYKLVALCLAITLFALVNTTRNHVGWVRVGVTYSLDSERAFVVEPPAFVEVSVRGSWRRVKQLTEEGLDPVRIKVPAESTSDFTVRDQFTLPPGVEFVSSDPRTLRVETDRSSEKSVKVVVKLEGLPKQGYEVTNATASPAVVKLSGAESVLARIPEIATAPVRLDERTESATEVTKLQLPNELVRTLPESVSVKIDVGERVVEKELGTFEVKLTTPPGTSFDFSPQKVRVLARGSGLALQSIPKISVHANLTAATDKEALCTVKPAVPGISFEVVPTSVVIKQSTR